MQFAHASWLASCSSPLSAVGPSIHSDSHSHRSSTHVMRVLPCLSISESVSLPRTAFESQSTLHVGAMFRLLEAGKSLLRVLTARAVVGDTHIHSSSAAHSMNKTSPISNFIAPTKSRIHLPACIMHRLRGWHRVRVHYA